jgi:hypothetical protein
LLSLLSNALLLLFSLTIAVYATLLVSVERPPPSVLRCAAVPAAILFCLLLLSLILLLPGLPIGLSLVLLLL